MVSARTHGEVLTSAAEASGVEIHLLGHPTGFSRDEVVGWMESLVTAAREGAGATSPDDPIPPPLRQALGGLLFSHSELWKDKGPCSVVLANEHGRVAFGWVGEASAEIHVDGHRIVPEWVSVRDHQGHEARAWGGDAAHDVHIEISLPGVEAAAGGLEARWIGLEAPHEEAAGVPEAGMGASTDVSDDAASTAVPPDVDLAAAAAVAGEGAESPIKDSPEDAEGFRPSTGVARWLEENLGWAREPSDRSAGSVAPAASAETREPVHAQEGAEPVSGAQEGAEPVSGAQEDAEPVSGAQEDAEPISDAQEDAEPISDAQEDAEPISGAWAEPRTPAEEQAAVISLPPGVPERIPPTPEPRTLTAGAILESFEVVDPRAIQLHGDAGEEKDPWTVALASLRGEFSTAEESAPPRPEAPASNAAAGDDRVSRPAGNAIRVTEAAAASGSGGGFADEGAVDAGRPATDRVEHARRPAWVSPPQGDHAASWIRWAVWTAVVLLLFGAGWMLGSSQDAAGPGQKASPLVLWLRSVGLAGARFESPVTSKPPGARIALDGKDTGLRTPATLDLAPGEHHVDLSFPDLGSASFLVKGEKGARVPLDALLWGSVEVVAPDPSTPVSVALDGESRGFAPLRLEALAPGPHELRFTGPGMASWGTTVEVRIGEKRDVLAYPLQSPATGLLQVRATINRDGEVQPLGGAKVFVDGAARGVTPMTLELPRGPHSVRVASSQEEIPIQVIDLPGGNQRFATFEFGLGLEYPKLALRVPQPFPAEEPVLISATLTRVPASDVREMWLHVRGSDQRWRRYPMTLLDAQGSAVGAAPFPAMAPGPEDATLYYVSALTSQGDEHFTELQTARREKLTPRR